MEIIVNFCGNCPFCVYQFDDFAMGDMVSYKCNLAIFLKMNDRLLLKEDDEPITPEWCPLKKEKYSYEFKNFSSKRISDIENTKNKIEELELFIQKSDDYESSEYVQKSDELQNFYNKLDKLYENEDLGFYEDDFKNDLNQKIEEIKEHLLNLENAGAKLQETFKKLGNENL